MKLRLVCSLTVTIASLFGYAAEINFEYGSLEFELASTFSRVEPVGKDRLGVVILDRLAGFSMSNLSTRVSRRLKANERLELLSGETVRFKQVRDACGWLDLTLGTNSLAFMGDVPQERVRTDGLFVCVDARAKGSPATGMASRERRYLIDVAGGWYYDVESRAFRQIVFPFSAPWKDWVDYAENYAQRAKVDWLGFCQRLGKGLYEKAVGDEELMSFSDRLPEGETYMVRRRDSSVSWFENLVLLKRLGKKNQILGVARVQDREIALVCRYDSEGRLTWLIQRLNGGEREFDCAFDQLGNLSRHLERRNGGREVLPSSRWFGTCAHVGPEGRLSFVSEVDNCLRPFDEAWRRGTYVDLSATVPTAERGLAAREEDVKTHENLKRVHEELEAEWARSNVLRRAQGLPPLTSWEKKLIRRAETLEKHRRDFEQWRLAVAGDKTTTEDDRLLDLERARLVCLKMVIDVDYQFAKGENGAHPERLEDLLSTRSLDRRHTILEDVSEIRDVWGRDYRYSYGMKGPKLTRASRAIIISAGPDGVFDTLDDLSSDDIYPLRQFLSQSK